MVILHLVQMTSLAMVFMGESQLFHPKADSYSMRGIPEERMVAGLMDSVESTEGEAEEEEDEDMLLVDGFFLLVFVS